MRVCVCVRVYVVGGAEEWRGPDTKHNDAVAGLDETCRARRPYSQLYFLVPFVSHMKSYNNNRVNMPVAEKLIQHAHAPFFIARHAVSHVDGRVDVAGREPGVKRCWWRPDGARC